MRPAILLLMLVAGSAWADGKVFAPREYKGSLEEQSQEAILIYTPGEKSEETMQDLILKIGVKGNVDRFAWVVPFPSEPKVEREDANLFAELFKYVESRWADRPRMKRSDEKTKSDAPKSDAPKPVEVLARKTVGSYDVAIVRENEAGALNRWLVGEGFQGLGDDAEDVLKFYREKQYVFACLKVKDVEPDEGKYIELHTLRFSFNTGRQEGIYFPMKLTGLQKDMFAINLYVFHRYWIDDHQSADGYEHRGFQLKYRDWDSSACKANAGKTYSAPQSDAFLQSKAYMLGDVTRLFRKLHPGKRYYLTKISGAFRPEDVRAWPDDLWLESYRSNPVDDDSGAVGVPPWVVWGGGVLAIGLMVGVIAGIRRMRAAPVAA